MTEPTLEVCFSPALLGTVSEKPDRNVVVVDILRATTAMCIAFGYGVSSVVPLVSREEAIEKKQKGWIVAGEEDGKKMPFADFGKLNQTDWEQLPTLVSYFILTGMVDFGLYPFTLHTVLG